MHRASNQPKRLRDGSEILQPEVRKVRRIESKSASGPRGTPLAERVRLLPGELQGRVVSFLPATEARFTMYELRLPDDAKCEPAAWESAARSTFDELLSITDGRMLHDYSLALNPGLAVPMRKFLLENGDALRYVSFKGVPEEVLYPLIRAAVGSHPDIQLAAAAFHRCELQVAVERYETILKAVEGKSDGRLRTSDIERRLVCLNPDLMASASNDTGYERLCLSAIGSVGARGRAMRYVECRLFLAEYAPALRKCLGAALRRFVDDGCRPDELAPHVLQWAAGWGRQFPLAEGMDSMGWVKFKYAHLERIGRSIVAKDVGLCKLLPQFPLSRPAGDDAFISCNPCIIVGCSPGASLELRALAVRVAKAQCTEATPSIALVNVLRGEPDSLVELLGPCEIVDREVLTLIDVGGLSAGQYERLCRFILDDPLRMEHVSLRTARPESKSGSGPVGRDLPDHQLFPLVEAAVRGLARQRSMPLVREDSDDESEGEEAADPLNPVHLAEYLNSIAGRDVDRVSRLRTFVRLLDQSRALHPRAACPSSWIRVDKLCEVRLALESTTLLQNDRADLDRTDGAAMTRWSLHDLIGSERRAMLRDYVFARPAALKFLRTPAIAALPDLPAASLATTELYRELLAAAVGGLVKDFKGSRHAAAALLREWLLECAAGGSTYTYTNFGEPTQMDRLTFMIDRLRDLEELPEGLKDPLSWLTATRWGSGCLTTELAARNPFPYITQHDSDISEPWAPGYVAALAVVSANPWLFSVIHAEDRAQVVSDAAFASPGSSNIWRFVRPDDLQEVLERFSDPRQQAVAIFSARQAGHDIAPQPIGKPAAIDGKSPSAIIPP